MRELPEPDIQPKEAQCCNNCEKRGPWKTEQHVWKNKTEAYELAECLHHPKPPFWRDSGPLFVMSFCGSECKSFSAIHEVSHKERA